MSCGRWALILRAVLVGAVAVLLGGPAAGQEQPSGVSNPAIRRLAVMAGRSIVLPTAFDIVRTAVTDPAIADATVVHRREILIDGKGAGTVSLIVWGQSQREQFDIVVEPGIGNLQRQFRTLFPGEDIRVTVSEEALILSGQVSDPEMSIRAGEIAQASSSKSKVVNMLRPPSLASSQQVMLQVRFAEVNRRALTELGASLIGRRAKFDARTATQQFAAPGFDDSASPGGLVFSDYLNLFFFWNPEGLGTVVRALRSKGYFHSLAEPNLIAYNGQEASFLAGGEFPVPIVQGNTNSVSVTYKEFGVRLTFRPTITGDQIRLKVKPEVSTLDFGNGITLSGFRIPALSTRRAETDVELKDGQSFAIAGLMNNVAQEDAAGIPVLSSLPIIGPLFKSRSTRKEQTELLVIVTPRLVRPLEDVAGPLPAAVLPVDPALFIPPAAPQKDPGEAPAAPDRTASPSAKPGGGA